MARTVKEIERDIEFYRELRNEAENKFTNEWGRICREWMSSGLPYDEAKKFADGGSKHLSDAAVRYGRCLERAREELEELKEFLNPDIKYQRLLKRKQLANTECEFRNVAELFREMNGYKNSKHLADECEKSADSIVEKERQEQERIAEKERIEKPLWDELCELEHDRREYENRKYGIEQRKLREQQGLYVNCGGKLTFFKRNCRDKCGRVTPRYLYSLSLTELDGNYSDPPM